MRRCWLHAERDDVLAVSEQVSRLPLGRITYGTKVVHIASLKN